MSYAFEKQIITFPAYVRDRRFIAAPLADVVIRSNDGELFHYYRSYLAARSEFFRTLFTGSMREARETYSVDHPLDLKRPGRTIRWVLNLISAVIEMQRPPAGSPASMPLDHFIDLLSALDEWRLTSLYTETGLYAGPLHDILCIMFSASSKLPVTALNELARFDLGDDFWYHFNTGFRFEEFPERSFKALSPALLARFNVTVVKHLPHILSWIEYFHFSIGELETIIRGNLRSKLREGEDARVHRIAELFITLNGCTGRKYVAGIIAAAYDIRAE